MRKILVTGIAGFIGFHVARKLVSKGFYVVGIDNINDYYDVNLKYARLEQLGFSKNEFITSNFQCKSKINDKLLFVRMNIEDKENLAKLFEKHKFDYVLNLAAQAGVRYSLKNPMAYVDSNLVGFMNILECCRYNEIKHLVYASSSSVYGENSSIPFKEDDLVDKPISLYAATKKANELMAYTYSHLYRLPSTGLRFFTVYGPWGRPDMAPMLFANAICNDIPIKVFNNGDMSRDFTYIDDIVNGVLIALNSTPIFKDNMPCYSVYNIGNGSPIRLMDFIKTLEEKLNKKSRKIMLDMQPGDVPRTWADTSMLRNLGYQSKIDIDEGVGLFVEWFKAFYLDA